MVPSNLIDKWGQDLKTFYERTSSIVPQFKMKAQAEKNLRTARLCVTA